MWPPFCLTTSCKRTLPFVTTFRHKSSESARHNFAMWALSCATFSDLFWPPKVEQLGTIFQPMRINSIPDVKCFFNNKNALCAQSMVWHFVRHPVYHLKGVCGGAVSSITDSVNGNFQWYYPSVHIMALGSKRRAAKFTTFICQLSWNLGASTSWNSLGQQ